MTPNHEKLNRMVEAVMNVLFTSEPENTFDALARRGFKAKIRVALEPECMELSDEEIRSEATETMPNVGEVDYEAAQARLYFLLGAKFYRDRE